MTSKTNTIANTSPASERSNPEERSMTLKNLNPTEQIIAKRRAEIAQRMHIAEFDSRFYILEIPAADGSPFEVGHGPFGGRGGAELFLNDMLDAYARGVPIDAIIEGGPDCDFIESYGEQAIILELLKGTEGIADPRALARELSNFCITRSNLERQLSGW
jgi:hypothetical protein